MSLVYLTVLDFLYILGNNITHEVYNIYIIVFSFVSILDYACFKYYYVIPMKQVGFYCRMFQCHYPKYCKMYNTSPIVRQCVLYILY